MSAPVLPASAGADRTIAARDLGGIRVLLCSLEADRALRAQLESTLSAAELARLARFGNDDLRRRYAIGRGTLRSLLAQELGVEAGAVALGRAPGGRPVLELPGAAVDFNVSHTREVVLIGIARGLAPDAHIGVDIEHEDRALSADRLARRYLAELERSAMAAIPGEHARRRRFLRLWTFKEAMSKATGDGLRAPMGSIDVDVDAPSGPRLRGGPPPYVADAWQLHAIELPGGYYGALAVWSPGAG